MDQPASSFRSAFTDRVRGRFGLVPNFFLLAPENPDVAEKLFAFAEFAYFDIPLPSLFKERLFVWLSRFCVVRYCIARHIGFLMGLGHSAGDRQAEAQTVEDVVRLLKRQLPRGTDLDSCISLCCGSPSPLAELPAPDSPLEQAVFAAASHVFLQTEDALRCLDALNRLLDGTRLQYLLVFLTFVRAAHYWTKVHPELELEDDIKQLLKMEEVLADRIRNDPETSKDPACASILDELPELRQRADRAISLLAAIVNSSEDAIVSKNLNGEITSWNKGAEKLFGYTAAEAIGKSITLLIPMGRLDEETTIIDRITRGECIEHCDTVRVRKDGKEIDVSLTISPVRDAAGKIVGASKIARDITQRKKIERELKDSEQRFRTLADALDVQVQFRTQELQRRNAEVLEQSRQLEGLSQRLLQAQDEERRRVSRDLRDSAGQTITALGITLSHFKQEAKANPALSRYLTDAEHLLKLLTKELDTASYLLHPPLLDESGLSYALRWFIDGSAHRSGLKIDLDIPEDFERLLPEMEIAIFRVIQECLTNIHRHSGSKTAGIRVGREGEHIFIEVQDRGRGISPERLAEVHRYGGGLGIQGMRERLFPFNGELTIDSNELGTKIRAVLLAKTLGEQRSTQKPGQADPLRKELAGAAD